MMSVPVINLSHLRVGPEQAPILEDINLTLPAGHFMGIVGPNGAGKSTLLSLIAGMVPPDHGHIDLFGECMTRHNRRRLLRRVGFLCQLHDHAPRLPLTVRDVVTMGLPGYHRPLWRRQAEGAGVDEALEQLGLTQLADRDFRTLSGGQRQRTRIARTLARKPQLLLLDEPSAALDSQWQERLYTLLRQLADSQDMTIVMVEHDIAAITAHVDSVACLNRKIHYHAMQGEQIPEEVWHAMYGDHIHIVAHDAGCIGCNHRGGASR